MLIDRPEPEPQAGLIGAAKESHACATPPVDLRWIVVGMLVAALGFSITAHEFAVETGHRNIDQAMTVWVQAVHSPLLQALLELVQALQTPVTAVVVGSAALLLVWRRHWMQFATLALMAPGGMLVNIGVKQVFHRARPALPHLAAAHGFSFPSGHTLAITVTCMFVLVVLFGWTQRTSMRVLGVGIALALVALVAMSRISLQVHYPSDTIAAVFAGITWAALSLLLIAVVERMRVRARSPGVARHIACLR